jgi:Heavy-metal resistance
VIRWWLLIGLLLSVGLNVGILAAIAARRGAPPPEARMQKAPEIPPGKDPLPLLPRLADRLGLEGETRRKFLDIQWNLFQETSHLRLQLGEVHRDIRRELTRDEPDDRRVDQLLNESARIYLALERSLVKNVLATRKLLDADQERQYMALIARLRIAGAAAGAGLEGPGPGLGPGAAQRPQGPVAPEMRRMMEERMEQRRLRQERMREGFPGRFQGRQRRFQRQRPDEPPDSGPPV